MVSSRRLLAFVPVFVLLTGLGQVPSAPARAAEEAWALERMASVPEFALPSDEYSTFLLSQTADDGYWLLTGMNPGVRESDDTHTYALSDGSATQRIVAPDVGDRFVSTATWSRPNATYRGGETVQLTLSVRVIEYVWNGTDDGYIHLGLNHVGDSVQARIDVAGLDYSGITAGAINLTGADGESSFSVNTDSGSIVVSEAGGTVSAAFPAGYENGQLKDIRVVTQSGVARYTYTWVYGEAPTATTTTSTTTIPDPYIHPSWGEWDAAHPTTTLAPVGPVLIPAGEAQIESEGETVGRVFPLYVFPAVHRRNADGQWEDLGTYGHIGDSSFAMDLKVGDRLVAGPGGSSFIVRMHGQMSFVSFLTYGGREAAVVLSPGAQIRVVQAPRQWLLGLGYPESAAGGMLQVETGTVQVRTAPGPIMTTGVSADKISYGVPSLTTPDGYVAQPKNTTFSLSADGDRAELRVLEGEVLFGPSDNASASVAVEGGNGVSLDSGQLGTLQAFDVAAAQQEWDALLPLAVRDEALENMPRGSVAVGIAVVALVGALAALLALAWGLRRPARRPGG